MPQLEAPQLEARRDLNAQRFIWSDAEGSDTALEAALTALGLTRGVLGADGMGVRLEDNLVVTEDGVEVLTSYPKRLAP